MDTLSLVSVGLSVVCAIVVVVRSFTKAEVKADDVSKVSADLAVLEKKTTAAHEALEKKTTEHFELLRTQTIMQHDKRLVEIEKQIALYGQAAARTDQDYLDLKEQINELRADVKGFGDKIVALTYALKGTKATSAKDTG